MIAYDLPASVNIGGREFRIRTDFRAILDIITALNDPELDNYDRAAVALGIFYKDEIPTDTEAAVRECMKFISGGEEKSGTKSGPRLVDWEKDFRWIVAPINRMLGQDVRGMRMHWWTFLSYYYEIGECTFSQIVRIRSFQAKGKKLDKADREWLRKNADLVRIDQQYTSEDTALLEQWTKGAANNAEQ